MREPNNLKGNIENDADKEPFCFPTELSVGYVVRVAARMLHCELEEVLVLSGVSTGQWLFLRALWTEDGLTQRELSVQAGLSEPTTAVALSGMEKSKLLHRIRDTEDRRKVRVYLTETGRSLREKLLPLVQDITIRATAGVAPQDLRKFHLVIDQITENLRAGRD